MTRSGPGPGTEAGRCLARRTRPGGSLRWRDTARVSDSVATVLYPAARLAAAALPGGPTAAAAMARFCGEIILPSTPPEEFAAAIRTGFSPVWWAAVTCRAPNSEFEDVSEPVTATPSQPRMGEIRANAAPA